MLPAVEQGNGPFIDPRSPTLNINRSPIGQEGVVTRASITKVKNLSAELMEAEATSTLQTPNNLLPKRFQSIVDPRSPCTFTRTPLVVDPYTPIAGRNDCSLTTVVSSLEYEDSTNVYEKENLDASFKDCESQLPPLYNLQIEYDESAPIIEPTDEKDDSMFEDAEVIPSLGTDPRSPSIAIVRTPVVFVQDDDDETVKEQADQQVEHVVGLTGHTKEVTDSQQRTPQQGIEDSKQGEQTPKKDKLTPNALKAGSRTPLGCMTNTGAISFASFGP